MVFNLEVEPPRDPPRHLPSVRAAGLALALVPVRGAVSHRVALGVLEVVAEREGDGESERLHHRHEPDVGDGGQGVVEEEGREGGGCDVEGSDGPRDRPRGLEVGVLEAEAPILRRNVSDVNGLGGEDRGDPVEGEDRQHVPVLEGVEGSAEGGVRRVVVEEEERIRALGIGVLGDVVGEGVVRPMLLQPQVLAPADHVRAEPEQLVPEGVGRDGAVVGVMLHVQANEGLRHAEREAEGPAAPEVHPAGEQTEVR
mmetsp:Transcript_7017/g.16319  ORF Transcript_7017/g.16319 Transcript_7017/m.16319 type:complete len:255 (-) Transcript_7017:424-1188(-)